jgi:hypothetical protein
MVKLVVTETTTTTNSGTDSEAEVGESTVETEQVQAAGSGLGFLVAGLIAKANELRGLKDKRPSIGEAYDEAKKRILPGSTADRSIYIDFSKTIAESYIDNIISLESKWWGVTLTKNEYAKSGKWGEQWVFVVDGTDWLTFMKNLEATKGKKITETHRGYHVGEPYPYEETDEEGNIIKPTYRGYSYINWQACVRVAEVAYYYKGNGEAISRELRYGGDSWSFLKGEGVLGEVRNPQSDMWVEAPEKIAAWIINHELSHGIYREREKEPEVVDIHDVIPFDEDIRGLEILLFYTDTGLKYLNKTLGENPEKDPNLFLDFTGGKGIKRKQK